MKTIILTLILFLPLVSFSQTQNSTTNPDWTNNGDWSGTSPDYSTNQSATFAMNANNNGNDITVNSGHTLRINAGVTLTIDKKITVASGGTLEVYGTIAGGGGSSEINCDKGTFIVHPGGSVTIDNIFNAQPPGSMTVDGDITVNSTFSNKMNVTGSGCITVNGSFNNDNGSGGVIFGCSSSGTGCCIGSCLLHKTEADAEFTANTTSIIEGQCINFTDASTNPPITTYSWTFTGGTPGTSTIANPSNICYNTAGTYNVQLDITNYNCQAPPNTELKINYITVIAATCSDVLQNGTETGVDCGGPCISCAARCSNSVQDGDETGVDCGGADCVTCAARCSNSIQDGDETGVDCGGADCVSCSAHCTNSIQDFDETGVDCGGIDCFACHCFNSIMDFDETGIDCGGVDCNSCHCANGIKDFDETGVDCGGADCLTCVARCSNGVQDGDETGVDCGGGSCF